MAAFVNTVYVRIYMVVQLFEQYGIEKSQTCCEADPIPSRHNAGVATQ